MDSSSSQPRDSSVASYIYAMTDQIEQMGVTIENQQKQLEELQSKYVNQVKECGELSSKLDATQKNLYQTSKLFSNTEEELRRSQYALKERDFVISEQKKAENALAHQACVLRADLEKSIRDNSSLFLKIAREDKLNAENRSVVNNFQTELGDQVSSLCKTVTRSISQQNEHLQQVEKLCNSFLDNHDKALSEIKKRTNTSKALFVSHFEAVQNVVRLHGASSNAALDEISTLAASNSQSIEKFLAAEAVEAKLGFDDILGTLSTHQGEMASFARELRQRFNAGVEHLTNISECIHEFIDKLTEESKRLERHATQIDEVQTKSIFEFQKAYEEQSRSDAEKLIADMTTLVSIHMLRQKELVDAKLVDLRETVSGNRTFLDGHISAVEGITTEAKRKWQDYFTQAESDVKDTADFSAAKHCRLELLLQESVSSTETALRRWENAQESLTKMGSQHATEIASLVRNLSDCNGQHLTEVDSARIAAVEDVVRDTEGTVQHFDGMSEQERQSISGILQVSKAHLGSLEKLQNDYSMQSASIGQKAQETFNQQYMDYEPTGATPSRSEPDIPSKSTIDGLRSLPMDALLEEFRENHSYESCQGKEVNPSLIPRSPLSQIN